MRSLSHPALILSLLVSLLSVSLSNSLLLKHLPDLSSYFFRSPYFLKSLFCCRAAPGWLVALSYQQCKITFSFCNLQTFSQYFLYFTLILFITY